MRSFTYSQPRSAAAAVQAASSPGASYLGGGTTLVDLMKLDVRQPTSLVDIRGLAHASEIEAGPAGLRIGALARMSDVAAHPAVSRDYPVISDSLLQAASPQLRHMARIGGNLLQSTRCSYFRDVSFKACNRRSPGSGCAAMDGVNRGHAILGVSPHCIATYPGDLAQALIALDATLDVRGRDGSRMLPLAKLHRLPGGAPQFETVLAPGELITAILVPAGPWTRRSLYLKIRDRASYSFALSSAAVALDLEHGVVRDARIALGGVATVPWRAHEAEAMLKGKPLDETSAARAGEAAFAGASMRVRNAFKAKLGPRTLQRALLAAARMQLA